MRIAGLPLWALVLVACVVAPFVIQLWVEADQRRTKERTRVMLRDLWTPKDETEDETASGTGRAASIEPRPDNDPHLMRDPHDAQNRDDE